MSRIVTAAAAFAAVALLLAPARGAEEWEELLQRALASPYSETRHNGLKGVDTSTARGLQVLWKVLDVHDPDRFDWYVREGAYDAILRAEGAEAEAEIRSVLEGRGHEAAKEAIVFAVIWKLRKEFVATEGRNDDEWIEDAKYRLRKTRGPAYFKMISPTIQAVDPDGRLFERIKLAFGDDRSSRVRIAALTGFVAYPHDDSLPLLFGHLEALEDKKKKYYREWCLTRFALEQLTGQDFREDVEAWLRWWKEEEGGFTVARRIEEAEEAGDDAQRPPHTVTRGDVTVELEGTRVHGNEDGYPLLVLPWRQREPDYFRPYFHGIEEECRVYYVAMPKVGDFKGLPRDPVSNLVQYPTEVLAGALGDMMKEAEKLERFGVLGHGPESSLLAVKLAAAHPDMVTHLILINPRSSGAEFGQAIDNVISLGRKRRCREIEKGGQSILIDQNTGAPTYEPGDSDEAGGLERALMNLKFADPCDPAVGQFDFLFESGDSAQTLADDSWDLQQVFPDPPRRLQSLVIYGARDPWTLASDVHRVGAILGTEPVTFRDSAQFPFMFETYAFNRVVRSFLEKAARAHQRQGR